MIFADVIIDISVKSLDRPFQYIVPEEMEFDVDIGSVVKIPFGMGNRTMTGYVVGLSGEAKFDISKTKSILEIIKQGGRGITPAFPCLLDKGKLRLNDE